MLHLKYLTIAFVIVQVAYSKKMRDDAVEYFTKLTTPYVDGCLQEANLTADGLEHLFDHSPLPESETTNSYLKCVYIKLEVIDSDGNIDLSVVDLEEAPFFTPEILDKCAKAASFGSTVYKKSYLLANCVVEALTV